MGTKFSIYYQNIQMNNKIVIHQSVVEVIGVFLNKH